MDKNIKQFITDIFLALIIIIVISVITESYIENEIYFKLLYSIILLILIGIIIVMSIQIKKSRNSKYSKLQELISYTQKREEIEQEINKLTYELMNSSLADYVDVNRLVFSGQDNLGINNIINYNAFLEQFGIKKDKLHIRKNFALFLSPFSKEGNRLFEVCQRILGGVDILLQRTNNVVEKDDILMNIVTLILQAELIIVNINGWNHNVYYELGIAHALGKQTILISKANYPQKKIGFDIRQKKIIMYKNDADLEKELLYQINNINKSSDEKSY